MKPSASAARKAYEGAALRGTTANRPLGSYVYEKRLMEKHTAVPCEVKVYRMRVRRQQAAWPEQAERKTLWFPPAAAIAAVSEDGLNAIIADFAGRKQNIESSRPKTKTKGRRSDGIE